MQPATNSQPAEKGVQVGDIIRTPQGLLLEVNLFNLPVIKRMMQANWPTPPPRHTSPAGPRRLLASRK